MLVTLGAFTLVAGVEPELFQARSCLPCHRIKNLSRMKCKSSVDRVEYLLEDAPTRSLLCHKVPRYQVSPNTLKQNYEACVTSPTPVHHSEGQVEAVVYHHELNWRLIYRWHLLSHSYCETVRNVDARSVRAFTGPKPFRLAHPDNPKSIKLGSEFCGRGNLKCLK